MSEKSKSRHRSSEEEAHTHLAIRVRDYSARESASISHEIYNTRVSWTAENDPINQFTTELAITGIFDLSGRTSRRYLPAHDSWRQRPINPTRY